MALSKLSAEYEVMDNNSSEDIPTAVPVLMATDSDQTSANPHEYDIISRLVAIKPQNMIDVLGTRNIRADYWQHNKLAIYLGEPKLITASNGISSLTQKDGKALYLVKNNRLRVCCNQYINYRDFNWKNPKEPGEEIVLCHLFLEKEGHQKNCSCGACGFTFDYIDPEPCCCPSKPPRDPGKEKCIIC